MVLSPASAQVLVLPALILWFALLSELELLVVLNPASAQALALILAGNLLGTLLSSLAGNLALGLAENPGVVLQALLET